MAYRMITNPDGTIIVVDTETGESINPNQAPSAPVQTVQTQSSVYGDLRQYSTYPIYETGTPALQGLSDWWEERKEDLDKSTDDPLLETLGSFGIGVGRGITEGIAATAVLAPIAIEAALKNPDKFSGALKPATEKMVGETVEYAQNNPAEFAGVVAGTLIAGKVGGKVVGKVTGKTPKTTGVAATDDLLMKTPPLEGTKLSTGIPKTLDRSSTFSEMPATQKVKLTSDQKLPELGRPQKQHFTTPENEFAGNVPDFAQQGVKTTPVRTGSPVEIKSTESQLRMSAREPELPSKIPVMTEQQIQTSVRTGAAETEYIDFVNGLSKKPYEKGFRFPTETELRVLDVKEQISPGIKPEPRMTKTEYEAFSAEVEYDIKINKLAGTKVKPPVDDFTGMLVGEVKRQIIPGEVKTRKSMKPLYDIEPKTTKISTGEVKTRKSGSSQLTELVSKPAKQTSKRSTSDLVSKIQGDKTSDFGRSKRITGSNEKTIFDTRFNTEKVTKTRNKQARGQDPIEFEELDLRQPQVSLPKVTKKPASGLMAFIGSTPKEKSRSGIANIPVSNVDNFNINIPAEDSLITQIQDTSTTPKPQTKPDFIPSLTYDPGTTPTPTKTTPPPETTTSRRRTSRRASSVFDPIETKRRKRLRTPDIEDEGKRKKKTRRASRKSRGWDITNPYLGLDEFLGKP